MAEDLEITQDKPCCETWKKKYCKVVEKCSKTAEARNQFKTCTILLQQRLDVIEEENNNLKRALGDLEVEVSRWKDEKEKESAIRVDLEDEVSALKEEIQLLNKDGNNASQEADGKLQERLNDAEKEINRLKELLVKEKARADSEKKKAQAEKNKAETEKKKANSALKEVEVEKKKTNELQGIANVERKKVEENRLLLEKLEKENDELKSMLASERSKSEAADKKLEAEKQKHIREKKRADSAVAKAEGQKKLAELNLKKAEEVKQVGEKLKMENEALKSMLNSERSRYEESQKKLEIEKQIAAKEKRRADLAVANAKEQQELAEANLKKIRLEKDRADDLHMKLEEERNMTGKLKELRQHLCNPKLVGDDLSNTGKITEHAADVFAGTEKSGSSMPLWMKKMLLEKEENLIREKKRADSGTRKAKKQMKIAEEQKQIAAVAKHRADQLSIELEAYKQRLAESQQELEENVSYKANTGNSLKYKNVSQADSVELLKKQLKLEKMFVKHAKKATKLETIRNDMLHQELFHLKQECHHFQQRLDMLDNNFFSDGEGRNELEKMDDPTITRKKLNSDGSNRLLTSGISYRLSPPCRGSKQKIIQSSAINSSSASFSDGQLVGSQERGTVSVMSSPKLGEDMSTLKPTVPRLFNNVRMKDNGNSIAENSVGSPCRANAHGRMDGCCEKKRILSVVQSVENLCFKGQRMHERVSEKLSQLQGVLYGEKDDPAQHNQQEYKFEKDARPFKRRKTSCDRAIVLHPSPESGEPKSMLDSGIDDSDAGIHASPPNVVAVTFDNHLEGGTGNTLGSNQCVAQDFENIEIYDYMKLLELDNDADEQSYRRAMAEPLSPSLPEIKFHGVESIEVDNPQTLGDKSFGEGSSIKDNLRPNSSVDIIGVKKNHSDLILNGIVSPQLRTGEDSVQLFKDSDILQVNEAHFPDVLSSGERIGVSDTACPGNEEMNKLSGNSIAPGDLLKYFVVFSENKDSNSILRIIKTINSCMPQCSVNHSADFLLDLLAALKNAQDLSAKERACVFASITLHQISEVGMRNLTNVLTDNSVRSIGSLTLHICSALSDPALRKIFTESCDLSELLCLIEDFLLQKKVLVDADASSESRVLCSPKVNLVLNGNAIMLAEQEASCDLLVAGASLLASLCSAFDLIGFICAASWNIFMTRTIDPATMLAVLHAFAHACGSNFFTLQQYTLAMTVVKSLVLLLEKQTASISPSVFSPSQGDNTCTNWSCNTNCPFSEGNVSVEDVVSLLFEKLQKYGQSTSCPRNLFELVNPLIPRVWSSEEGIEAISGLKEGVDSMGDESDENFLSFTDILSSVEILASFMGWDWTRDNIIGQLCELMESRLAEGFSAAIAILLGQLGRLGVDASGYDDIGIKKLRGLLSSFLCESTFSKVSLPVQFAIVTAFFSISPIKVEEMVENKVGTPVHTFQSIPAYFVKKWFSLLSHEQQSFFRLQQADV